MKTVILAISLFNAQPAQPAVDFQWFDQQAMRDHLVSYIKDDRNSVTSVLASTFEELLANSQELADALGEPADTTQVIAKSTVPQYITLPQANSQDNP